MLTYFHIPSTEDNDDEMRESIGSRHIITIITFHVAPEIVINQS